MSEQRIDTGAEAATSTDADPGEGQGAGPQAQRAAGTDAEMPQPTADRPGAPGVDGDADTEGAAALQEAEQTAAAQQRREPDLSGGREPTGSDPGGTGGGTAPVEDRPARAETGEVSAAPSPQRRAEDPGSVATEFGDRADSAPEDDIARPTI